jgi:ABC-2 type transport system permease protein
VAFAISLVLANAIAFAWNFMLELTGFWTLQTKGIRQVALSVMLFLSGFIVPVRLFPEPLRSVALALPFASITQTPCDLFLEHLAPTQALGAMAFQALWAVAMLAAAQGLVSAATRRVVTQGG